MKINSKVGPLMAPLPTVMVSCGDMDNSNILTIAWTGIINSNPPMTYISVQPIRHSYDIIKQSGEFVINLTGEELTKAMDYCGVKSGRQVDKFKELGLHKAPADCVAAPLIEEAPVNIECRVLESKLLGSHEMFIAEILAVHIDDKYVDEKGAYDFGRMKLVAFSHGKYYALKAEALGFFGYSIMKPKTEKRKRAEAGAQRRTAGRTKSSRVSKNK